MKIFIVLVTLLMLNVLYLDWKFFFDKPKSQDVLPLLTTSEKPTTTLASGATQACSPSCVTLIKQATQAAKQTTTETVTTTSSVKEFFIPLGSSSTTSTSWTDTGLEAYIDTTNYSRIKQVTFEASVHVPTGNETVNVRLYNATDNHPVWFSEVFFNGGTNAQLLISQPITLDPGNKRYKVQMKAQLTFPAILDQSRVHILTY